MRRRLATVYLSLLATVSVGLAVPLSTVTVTRDTQALLIDRLQDTARFASLAEPTLHTGRASALVTALATQLRQYQASHGVAVAVVGRNGTPVLSVGTGLRVDQSPVRAHVEAALSGERIAASGAVWPWQRGPLVVAEPVGRGGQIVGALVTVSPTDRLRAATGWRWAALACLDGLVIAVGLALARPLSRWVLGPVHELNAATRALAEGRLRRVGGDSGPPELRRLVQSFNDMAEQTTALIDRQRSFVSYAGHQLRTPLAALRIAVDDLAPDGQAGDRGRQIAVLEVERLAAILDAMLRFAQVGVNAADLVAVDVADAAGRLVAARQPVARRAGVQLTFAADGPALARAASTVIEQAVDALIDNARKYAGPGARVRVRAGAGPPGWIDLTIADDGPGMSPPDLTKAIEPFWRHPAQQVRYGVGLGLAIVDELVRASGGRLHLQAARPHGLVAVVRLPAAPDSAEPGSRPAPMAGPP
jgi:signal transduction histidine kinase